MSDPFSRRTGTGPSLAENACPKYGPLLIVW